MLTLQNILSGGYFPKELPSAFSTKSFANAISEDTDLFARKFTLSRNATFGIDEHTISTSSINRRQLGLPNPVVQYNLAKIITSHWVEVKELTERSPISMSKPIEHHNTYRSVVAEFPHDSLPLFKLSTRATSKYILKTDILNFYPSIYTHSIPWAIHGKVEAKTKRHDLSLWGNVIDKFFMKGQYDQTRGIPIGPDTSFITSEIILSALDIDLCSQMSLNGFRHHDDYEFGFDNFRSAEQCLSILRDVARKYELHLNPTKTHIIELPYLLEFNWASELLNYSFENNRKGKARALINYFDKAFIHASQYERSNVLNLSLAHLDTLINEEFWINEGERNLIVDFTLQCMSVDSSTLHKGIKILTNFHQRGHELNFLPVDSVLNDQIVSSSLSDSANQIAWSIWALLFFGIPISASAIKAISKMQDSVVALLALDAESRGFTCDKIDKSYWTQLLEGDCLHESLWLLAYESCKHGWIDFGARNPITENEQFTALLSHDVSFYNTEKVWCAVGVGETINDDELFLPLSTSFFY